MRQDNRYLLWQNDMKRMAKICIPLYTEFLDKNDIAGSGVDQVVSVLVFYSDDPSWNPAEVYNF